MRIGIDLGGTKIEAIALMPDGTVLARKREATPQGDYRGILRTIADLVLGLEKQFQRKGSVGIGTPGSLSPRTGLDPQFEQHGPQRQALRPGHRGISGPARPRRQ